MTQTTGGLSFTKAKVFVSTDNSSWTDVSGHAASVAVSGGSRAVGEQNTFDGLTPIVTTGKRAATDVTVRFVYTETAAEPFEVIRAQHEDADGTLYVQYTPVEPSGFWFKSGAGILMDMTYPQGEVPSGDPIMSEFTVKCGALTKASAST